MRSTSRRVCVDDYSPWLFDSGSQLVDLMQMTDRTAPFDILQWLSEEEGTAFMAAGRLRRVSKGEVVYRQSDDGNEMYRLTSGSVRLSVMNEDGRDLFYRLFGPGDCFGTSSVVDGEPRPQTATAFAEIEFQVFSRRVIDQLRLNYPNVNNALLKLLSRHMRVLSDYFAGAALDQTSFRLAQRLVDMADDFGTATEEGVVLSSQLSQSELAAMVGATRQTINRLLQDFQLKGWLLVRSGAVTLVDVPKLKMIARNGMYLRDLDR